MPRNLLKYFFFYFLPLIVLFGAAFSTLYYSDVRAERKVIEGQEQNITAAQLDIITTEFQAIVSDLKFLGEGGELLGLLEGDAGARASLRAEYLSISKNKKMYDQVRFLDKSGQEIIRINFNKGNPTIVTENKLQNKGKRYYFTDVIVLDKGDIFVSPFDLNVEHGAVEQPLKPMIRFGTPIFDRQNQRQGIVLLNYFGNDLLAKFNRLADKAGGEVMLLNADGFWLKGPLAADEWGFMYKDRHNLTFARSYPQAWERIKGGDGGQFYIDDDLFTFKTIYPLSAGIKSSSGSGAAFATSKKKIASQQYYWKIVSRVPQDVLLAGPKAFFTSSIPVAIFIVVILAGLSGLLARARCVREEAEDAMRVSEERFRTLFDRANDAIIVQNMNGAIVRVNEKVASIWQFSIEELLNMQIADLHMADLSPASGGGDSPFETITKRKDGGQVPVEIASSLLDADGEKLRMLIVRDITSRKDAEAQLAAAHKQLVDSAHKAGMADIATGILHNLGNVLNNVNSSMEDTARVVAGSKVKSLLNANELLLEHKNDLTKYLTEDDKGSKLPEFYLRLGNVLLDENEKISTNLSRIEERISTMKGIVETQQEYARAEYHSEKEPIDKIIKDVLKIQKDQLTSAGVKVDCIYETAPPCEVHKYKLVQVLINLVKNAVEAMAGNDDINKTKELQITSGKLDDSHNFIKISDNGSGILAANLVQIFNHGFSTKTDGYGFGLHACANALTEMGGSISVESDGEGQGASFLVQLPL